MKIILIIFVTFLIPALSYSNTNKCENSFKSPQRALLLIDKLSKKLSAPQKNGTDTTKYNMKWYIDFETYLRMMITNKSRKFSLPKYNIKNDDVIIELLLKTNPIFSGPIIFNQKLHKNMIDNVINIWNKIIDKFSLNYLTPLQFSKRTYAKQYIIGMAIIQKLNGSKSPKLIFSNLDNPQEVLKNYVTFWIEAENLINKPINFHLFSSIVLIKQFLNQSLDADLLQEFIDMFDNMNFPLPMKDLNKAAFFILRFLGWGHEEDINKIIKWLS